MASLGHPVGTEAVQPGDIVVIQAELGADGGTIEMMTVETSTFATSYTLDEVFDTAPVIETPARLTQRFQATRSRSISASDRHPVSAIVRSRPVAQEVEQPVDAGLAAGAEGVGDRAARSTPHRHPGPTP